jgi:hypothetical protein
MKGVARWSNAILPMLTIVAALLAHVDVATRGTWDRLARLRASRLGRLGAAAAASLAAYAWSGDPMALALPGLAFGAVLTEGQHAGEFLLGERTIDARETITVLSGQNLKAGAVVGRVTKGVGRVTIPTVVGTGNGTATVVFAGPEVLKGNYVVTCITAAANGGTFSVVNPAGKALPNAVVGTPYRSREINFTLNDGATDFIVGDVFTFVVDTTAPAVVGTGNGTISGLSLGPDAKPGNYRVENVAVVTNGGEFKVVGPDGDVVAVGFIVAGAGGTLVLANQRQLNLTITDGSTDFALADAFNVCVFNELVAKAVAWDPLTFDGRDDAAGILYDNVDASAADKPGVLVSRGAEVMKGSLIWAAAITAAQKESAYRDLAARGVVAL